MLAMDKNGKPVHLFTPAQYRVLKSAQIPNVISNDVFLTDSAPSNCEYCGSMLPTGTYKCPNCGAPISRRKRVEIIELLDDVPIQIVTEEDYLAMFGPNGERSAGWHKSDQPDLP